MSQWRRLDKVTDIISALVKHEGNLLICIDAQVERLYASALAPLKSRANTIWFTFAAGESSKNFAEWERAQEFFIERGASRSSHLVAIGGGALSDVAGFVAATLFRGITWSVVPTTLLSQVDASIGGKVAVNTKNGKNLVGSFHQPQTIYACGTFLETISTLEQQSGKGEILKYAFLSKQIYDLIDKNHGLDEVVDACAQFKLKLVENDLYEKGVRKNLNLGHTFGHGIEWIYKIPHGIAVIWGMAIIFILEERQDLLQKWRELALKLELEQLELPWTQESWNEAEMINVITKDKKNLDRETIHLVVARDIGEVTFEARQWPKLIQTFKNKREDFIALSLS